MPVPQLERARILLVHGAGYDMREGGRDMGGWRSAERCSVEFSNTINALALGDTWGDTWLPQVRVRQAEVFRVLAVVGVEVASRRERIHGDVFNLFISCFGLVYVT